MHLAKHLGEAIFHAAVHVAGHETYHHIKHKFTERWLRNHDVSRILNESYIAALEMLEREFKTRAAAADHATAADSFARLRAKAAEFFPVEKGSAAFTELQAAEMLKDASIVGGLVPELLRIAEPAPAALRPVLEGSFAPTFAFTFRELGLKGNEKVRAVITHELLADLRQSAGVSAEKLADVERSLGRLDTLLDQQDEMRRFQERFATTLREGLGLVAEKVDHVSQKVDAIAAAMTREAPLRAWVVVADKDGNQVGRQALRGDTATFGRDAGNTVQLSHAQVSGVHAELRMDGTVFVLKDRNSRNGTFVGGAKIREHMLLIGQKVRMGPFTLELQPADAGLQLGGGTIPMDG